MSKPTGRGILNLDYWIRINWTVYGKIDSISKADGSTVKYYYDAAGNRISKTLVKAGIKNITGYVRDATGNTLSVYNAIDTVSNGHLIQTEMGLYGSSRLGIWKPGIDVDSIAARTDTVVPFAGNGYTLTFRRGNKLFELENHLGNVLATVSDRNHQHSSNGSSVDYYNPDLVSAGDYYPFGMQMPSRNITGSTAYRYGFNGKELDPNMDGNNYDYGFRIYNPQIGKFLSTDPLMKKYPELTPYQFASNSPISGIDLDGLEYYYAADGKYLGHRTKGADGKELSLDVTNDVRIVESVIKTKEYTLYNGVKDLHIKHKDFQEAVSIVKHEGDTKDENEYMGIAFQFYNNSKLHKKSLISTIRKESSVYNNPDVASVRYEPTDNSISVLASRKGVLSALSGGVDPTNGATQNDGNDFLSWGA